MIIINKVTHNWINVSLVANEIYIYTTNIYKTIVQIRNVIEI